MRHRFGYRKLGMKSPHRRAVLRNMATSLLLHERISTTVPRAKELRRIVERMITLGKRGNLHARRQAASFLFDNAAVIKVFSDLAERFKERKGGYTRILKKGPRKGDCAEMAFIEFVDYEYKTKERAPKKKEEQPTAPPPGL